MTIGVLSKESARILELAVGMKPCYMKPKEEVYGDLIGHYRIMIACHLDLGVALCPSNKGNPDSVIQSTIHAFLGVVRSNEDQANLSQSQMIQDCLREMRAHAQYEMVSIQV